IFGFHTSIELDFTCNNWLRFDAIIHFTGLKVVGESVDNPRQYFNNNLIGTINLYEIMAKYNCKKMVFSSFATVYGQSEKIPCVEDFELKVMNPYVCFDVVGHVCTDISFDTKTGNFTKCKARLSFTNAYLIASLAL
ncbi:hypothetical protein Gotri_023932, partial [Gossypium trilobum]|nr:hypothetical protein [Gossypium trilobum]